MSLEQELFTWSGWDGDPECMIFYDATLIVPIGKFPVGTKFDWAIISVGKDDDTVLQLNDKGEEDEQGCAPNIVRGEYKLHYRIGETVTEN